MLEKSSRGLWARFLWGSAIVSALISVVAFHPSVPQNSREPTWLATFLWTRLPAWNNPLPEVFTETELHVDEPRVPVATAGCEKILVAGGNADTGIWPVPCYPAPIPAECQRPGAMCYANLAGRRYEFVPVQDGWVGADALRREAVWPGEAVPHARQLYEAWNWPALRSASAPLGIVRAAEKVSVDSIGSEEHFILVLRNLEPGAVVRLRPTGPLRGVLIDGLTGQTLRAEQYDGAPGGLMSIDLPHEFEILLLAMQTDTSR